MEWTTILICLGIGLLVAFIVTAVMKGQLKTVHHNDSAADYVRPGSMQVDISTEQFLYRNVTRTPKPKDNNKS